MLYPLIIAINVFVISHVVPFIRMKVLTLSVFLMFFIYLFKSAISWDQDFFNHIIYPLQQDFVDLEILKSENFQNG